uniref:Guanine nucleotide exchange factor DBS-like spectrin-like domain-containing protein n=1 Tax=Panagrolaimus davidi TaxID=227884 RepID=A0A914QDJ5_9BILA
MNALDEFLHEGERLHLDSLKQTPNMNNLILLTTTETSSLLAQVAERIDDIRRLGAARRDALHKLTETKTSLPQSASTNSSNINSKPVQIVSPEKKFPTSRGNSISSNGSSIASSPTGSVKSPLRVGFESF